jgi:uncharacterized protein YcbX
MAMIGTVSSVWRYPVKSMAGEEMAQAFVGYAGLYGDRMYAFTSAANPEIFPYVTGRQAARMLAFQPRFRQGESSAIPPNWAEAQATGPGLTPLYDDAMAVDVALPSGEKFALDDPELAALLGDGLGLLRSERALTDCRPVSLFALQTGAQLATEIGVDIDHRRFRANLYLDLADQPGFAEERYLGRRLRIGERVELTATVRDPRCKMISLDPDTGEENRDVLRKVAREHDGAAGVYAVVLLEGVVRPGDPVELLD